MTLLKRFSTECLYPKMAVRELKLNLRPLIKKFEVYTKKNTMGDLTGSYVTAIKGRGLEFEGFRPYSINDDASQIDWKASLRAQDTLVKKFVEERNLNVFFMFDVSNSMLFASTDKLKAEYGAELVASMLFAILQAGDYAGLAMLSDKVVKVVPMMSGTRQYYVLIKQLSNPDLYGGGFSFEAGLRFLIDYLTKRALVVIVSDFIGLKGDWEPHLSVASQKFDIMPIMIRDPHDTMLPEDVGQVVIQDPYSEEQIVIDSSAIRDEYEARAAEQVQGIRDSFKKRRLPLLELYTDRSFVNPVVNFLKQRGNQRGNK
ncbi:MAG: DUF58 domain-containing protein [Candidatus Woesearchaeota archaeon]